MAILKEIEYEEIDFEVHSSQQFATVVFDRGEDDEQALITVIKDRKINQFEGNNKYNPSARRRSTCIYAKEEWEGGRVIKICTIQHKGTTLIEVHSVAQAELDYLFKNA
ncbi:short-chain dehydrogenase [Thiocapsa rosea]|uniref:short-chain dehydrogenase n=1 Tax=Thiocapsa rosea TaxID=69360 RepID=UPI000EB5CC58|nr:short-chain dehydrogenase [Thiocapsa rosea]